MKIKLILAVVFATGILSFAQNSAAQNSELVPLIEILGQVSDAPDGDTSKAIYLMQRCSGLQLALSSLFEESSPDLSEIAVGLSSSLAIQAASLRINLARERGISDPDVERMAIEVRELVTLLYQDYMDWANNNYRRQGAYFESDAQFQQEIEICGALAEN